MHTSALANQNRCLFSSALAAYARAVGWNGQDPPVCATLGEFLQVAGSTVSRRVRRLLTGQALRRVGRPNLYTAREVRRLAKRCARLAARVQEEEARRQAQQAEDQEALEAQTLGLLFHGASLRGAAECLELGWGAEAAGKSTLATQLNEFGQAATELFLQYCAGRGRIVACDEIFVSGHPCLEVVDLLSLALVGLCPQTEASCARWVALLQTFSYLEAGVSDQGLGVSRALAQCAERANLDVWHLLRNFAAEVGRLEREAYARMEAEYDLQAAFVAGVPYAPGKQLPPAFLRWEEAQAKTARACSLHAAADTLCGWLYASTEPVDEEGKVRTPAQAEPEWETALDLVDQTEATGLYRLADKLRGKMTGAHLQGLAERLASVPVPSGWEACQMEVQAWTCRAWRLHHARGTHLLAAPCVAGEQMARELGVPEQAEEFTAYAGQVFRLLDETPRASSAVECVNSLIRLREGAKRHPHPGFIYLLAWLHNTRPFSEGRRKGLTPLEIMGIKLPAKGWQMLMERVRQLRAARKGQPDLPCTAA